MTLARPLRRAVLLSSVALALLVPSLADAQLLLGLRLGYAVPGGAVAPRAQYGHNVTAFVPVQLDAAIELAGGVGFGGYAAYGVADLAPELARICVSLEARCSGRQARLGAQVTWALRRASPKFVPWFALGGGVEWMTVRSEYGGTYSQDRWSGLEGNLTFGVDLKRGGPTFGPFLSLGLGQYDQVRHDLEGTVGTSELAHPTWHRQVSFGLRGLLQI